MFRRPIRLASLAPLILGFPASQAACGDSSGPEDPEPAGLIVAGGQNAAFPGDTFALHTWFTDSEGLPLGVRPTDVQWTSSASEVVVHRGDSVFMALELGTSTLTARVGFQRATFSANREFHVIPALTGRVVWGRQTELLGPAKVVSRELPKGPITPGPAFGHPNTPHANAALSPDGRTMAVQATRPVSEIGDAAIYLVDLETNEVTGLTDSMPGDQITPRWSPGGDLVLFASNAGGPWNIWSVPPNGGQPQVRVRLNAPLPVVFDISPTDDTLVIRVTNADGEDNLWVAVLDGSLGRQLTSFQSSRPRVSPDGGTIAYNGRSAEGGDAVFLVPRAGGTPRQLLPDVRAPRQPTLRTNTFVRPSSPGAWSSDGAFLVLTWSVDAHYMAPQDGLIEHWSYPGELYAASADGRWRVRLTTWRWADVQADYR